MVESADGAHDTEIRPYHPGDRQAVLDIAADTGFFGSPVEHYLDDRRLFLDLVYKYYLDIEPEHAWVAVTGAGVVGFLVGAVDSRRVNARIARYIAPLVLLRLLTSGRYTVGPATRRYAGRLLRAWLYGEYPTADPVLFPAHLHINVGAGQRGRGLGRGLLEAYFGQLRALGVPGVHLHTTSHNVAACHLYQRAGFCLVSARQTRIWEGLVSGPVENRCYALLLRQPDAV